jgi:hypothetical protein
LVGMVERHDEPAAAREFELQPFPDACQGQHGRCRRSPAS